MRYASFCAVLVAVSACAHVRGGQPAQVETIDVGGAIFRLQYGPEDIDAARQVRRALRRAVPAAERWGKLSAPVLITIHSTHEALTAAAHREGYGWLRAWARYASVDLQSPRTWSFGASDTAVAQLLAHELTHCVMYQSAATERTWSDRDIPLWFREGMASVTAGQEHRRAGPETIRAFYRTRAAAIDAQQPGDPFTDPEPLCRSDSALVYGTAHRAFHFLLDRYGEERVRLLIARMGQGADFSDAFRQAVGVPLRDFEGDFERELARSDRSG